MEKRLNEKISETRKYLDELSSIVPLSFDEYKLNFQKRAACERYAEKIVEAIIDIIFIIVKKEKLAIPDNESISFDMLAKKGIISSSLAVKLKEAKGMRNILAHEYGKLDNSIIFQAVSGELDYDFQQLVGEIGRYYKSK